MRTLVFVAALAACSGLALAGDTPRQAGEQAPEFSLPASDGRTLGLADFRGRKLVVLAFFPKAFTGG